mgnify:CR=1 FL=1
MLIASPAACAEYWAAIKIHAGLEWELASSENWGAAIERLLGKALTSDGAVESSPPLAGPGRRSRSFRTGLVLAAAACLLVGIFMEVGRPWRQIAVKAPDLSKSPETRTADPVLGRLTPLAPDSRWSFGRRSDRDSPEVRLGDTLSIDVGAVALRLNNDVVAQMKAPLVLHLISVERVRLLHGRIQVDVPKGAEGFSVETAAAEIVDFGTTFSVEAVGGGTDLIVHQGEVDLKVTGDSAAKQQPGSAVKRLRGGEAVRVHVDGTLSRVVHVEAGCMLTSD